MAWDWLSAAVSGTVGVAGLYFGWLSGKQSRDHAERLSRHNDEHARLMAEQRDAHARTMEENRRLHEQRMGEEERRQQRLAEAYLEIMTTAIRIGQALREDGGPVPVHDDLVRATALAETFASRDALGLFEKWRDTVYRAIEADERFKANSAADEPAKAAVDMRLHWRRQVRDLRLKEADRRRALADAVSAELHARRAAERG
jgi:hypothetical protein